MARRIDIIGERFSRLTVMEYSSSGKCGQSKWKCLCDCGKIIEVYGHSLKSGNTKSCGCWNLEKVKQRFTKHSMKGTKIYNTWMNMKNRCRHPKSNNYKWYGGKGITVCEEWFDFNNFHNWAMSNGYNDDLTLDRLDNKKNYEPDNCRWTTWKEQHNNQGNNVRYFFNNKEQTLSQWAEEYGLKPKTVQLRFRRGLREGELLQPLMRK